MPGTPQATNTEVEEELELHKRSGAQFLEKQVRVHIFPRVWVTLVPWLWVTCSIVLGPAALR